MRTIASTTLIHHVKSSTITLNEEDGLYVVECRLSFAPEIVRNRFSDYQEAAARYAVCVIASLAWATPDE